MKCILFRYPRVERDANLVIGESSEGFKLCNIQWAPGRQRPKKCSYPGGAVLAQCMSLVLSAQVSILEKKGIEEEGCLVQVS